MPGCASMIAGWAPGSGYWLTGATADLDQARTGAITRVTPVD